MQTMERTISTAMQGLTTPTPQPTTLRPEFVEWLKFQTFEDPELIKTATGCQEWATAFKSKAAPRWLSLIGMTGTGKTHCAKKLWAYAKSASDWSSYSYFPKMIFWPDFIQLLRAGDSFEMRQEMKRWPVLFLDDIGAERDPSGFAAEELNTLLGCRMDKWTLITSNKDIDGLHAIDRRIASRIVRPPNICVGIKSMDFGNRGNK